MMKAAEFDRELERVGITRKHADEAFEWIRQHGERGVHDIFYYRTCPSKKKNAVAVLDKKRNRYFMRQAGMLMYLLARKDKGELDEDPPFDKEWKYNKIEKSVHRSFCKKVFKKLGIKIKRYSKSGKDITLSVRVDKKSSS